eukprot:TRINITY_DN5985_c0_g1_i3.p1 TRINITY_DN5985_c0_g1~~TRINITY_DN5985_c0_g1_i3.p1  ORF type:complete len:200 (+),score=36.07 TRINITY_DN5985_c0_g1_i3:204-803(+)
MSEETLNQKDEALRGSISCLRAMEESFRQKQADLQCYHGQQASLLEKARADLAIARQALNARDRELKGVQRELQTTSETLEQTGADLAAIRSQAKEQGCRLSKLMGQLARQGVAHQKSLKQVERLSEENTELREKLKHAHLATPPDSWSPSRWVELDTDHSALPHPPVTRHPSQLEAEHDAPLFIQGHPSGPTEDDLEF